MITKTRLMKYGSRLLPFIASVCIALAYLSFSADAVVIPNAEHLPVFHRMDIRGFGRTATGAAVPATTNTISDVRYSSMIGLTRYPSFEVSGGTGTTAPTFWRSETFEKTPPGLPTSWVTAKVDSRTTGTNPVFVFGVDMTLAPSNTFGDIVLQEGATFALYYLLPMLALDMVDSSGTVAYKNVVSDALFILDDGAVIGIPSPSSYDVLFSFNTNVSIGDGSGSSSTRRVSFSSWHVIRLEFTVPLGTNYSLGAGDGIRAEFVATWSDVSYNFNVEQTSQELKDNGHSFFGFPSSTGVRNAYGFAGQIAVSPWLQMIDSGDAIRASAAGGGAGGDENVVAALNKLMGENWDEIVDDANAYVDSAQDVVDNAQAVEDGLMLEAQGALDNFEMKLPGDTPDMPSFGSAMNTIGGGIEKLLSFPMVLTMASVGGVFVVLYVIFKRGSG